MKDAEEIKKLIEERIKWHDDMAGYYLDQGDESMALKYLTVKFELTDLLNEIEGE